MSISNNHRPFSSYRYSLPKHTGDLHILGQLFGSACSLECAEIVEYYQGPVMLITPDMQNAIRLRDEIKQFTDKKITTLSDWETLPYDFFSPNHNITASRLLNLYHLPTMEKGVIILPVNTLMQRVCPHEFLHDYALTLKKGQVISRNKLYSQLEKSGYRSVIQVIGHGEFSAHDSLFYLYPMGSEEPLRISLFDNKINSIRTIDINSQRTISEVKTIHLLPTHEFPTDPNAISLFLNQWRMQFDVQCDPEHIYQQVSKGILPAGIEYWQVLFFNQPLPTLFSYLPNDTLILNTSNIEHAAMQFWNDINRRYQNRRMDPMRPPVAPDKMYLHVDKLFGKLKSWPRMILEQKELPDTLYNTNLGYFALPDIRIQIQNKIHLEHLRRFIKDFDGSIIFSVESEGRREALQDLLSPLNLTTSLIKRLDQARQNGLYMMVGACEHGFFNSIRKLALICENDLLSARSIFRQKHNHHTISNALIHNLEELHPGQPVVHFDHGVGRYMGLTTLETGGIKGEYLILSYAGEDKLYVPVSSLHLISRYASGSNENAPIYKLGGDNWIRVKQKAVEQVRDIAAELLDIYAKRAAKTGFAFKYNPEQYKLFCQTFPFETTPDQQQAINCVLSDMCQPLAMDRLVCGDVGFGKTEVAMRAAFVAVENSKQVAVLVPTTLLAQQHFDNFRDRFATWPIRIEMMSRFRRAKEQQKVLRSASTGKVDIIIGTHKLLQGDLYWKDLGLLIVDEEHRFGVRDKECIKTMRANVDILTLTATPIPRTLNMTMSGIRDLSIITTPPARRLAVKTFVREYNSLMVREAILREILRGGQVYYLYNNVDNIENTAQKISQLVPEARVTVGHGQMRERILERVMNDFIHQRFNVLVCTTIIETGIDIASANTIIIERADRFGLAQLHQLRGRVGRSHHQAYAYLLTPNPKVISADAQKRLAAISSLEDLGAGFALATHDLEIRGAGELLGEDQSGQIKTIGFSLYTELLDRAVYSLKNGHEPSLEDILSKKSIVELRIPTLLPDDYVSEVNIRLSLYKRIANVKNSQELEALRVEIISRFGAMPEAAKNLLKRAELCQYAKILGIIRIESNEKGGFIEFSENNCVDPNYLINLLKTNPHVYALHGPKKLKFMLDLSDHQRRLKFIADLLSTFFAHRLPLSA